MYNYRGRRRCSTCIYYDRYIDEVVRETIEVRIDLNFSAFQTVLVVFNIMTCFTLFNYLKFKFNSAQKSLLVPYILLSICCFYQYLERDRSNHRRMRNFQKIASAITFLILMALLPDPCLVLGIKTTKIDITVCAKILTICACFLFE